MQWFRMYAEVLNDPKVQTLSPELFKHWVNLLCVACNNNGTLPVTLHETAYALRVTEDAVTEALGALHKRGLLDLVDGVYTPHAWDKRQYKSDTSNERVKRYRQRKCNVTVTPPDTDTDTEIKEDKSSFKQTTKTQNVKQEKNRGTRLEATLAGLTDAEKQEWANWPRHEFGWEPGRCRSVGNEFRDYWAAQPGGKGVKLDWFATWRNWCRRANERSSTGRNGPGYLTAGQKNAAGAVLESAGWSAVAAERRE